jgi:hypothetical protein
MFELLKVLGVLGAIDPHTVKMLDFAKNKGLGGGGAGGGGVAGGGGGAAGGGGDGKGGKTTSALLDAESLPGPISEDGHSRIDYQNTPLSQSRMLTYADVC